MAPFVSFGHVHITFDEGRWQSEYEITVEEQAQPRSKVLALSSEIDRIIDEQRTWSWIFHPRPVLGFLRWVLVVGLAGYLIGQFVSLGWGVLLAGLSPPLFPIIGAVLILDSLYSACKWLRPYCRFDTNRNNDKDIWFKWLRNGIVSLIGLAVAAILAIVRK